MSDGNFYVSDVNGDDGTGDGTIGTPWATIGHAFDTINSTNGLQDGDTIWVAPGVYYEVVSIAVDGGDAPGSGTEAYVIGDVNLSQAWTGEEPGICVITAADSGDDQMDGTDTAIVEWGTNEYVEFHNFQMDGLTQAGANDYAVHASTGAYAGQKIVNCVVGGSGRGCGRVAAEDCVIMGANENAYNCNASQEAYIKRCILLGGNYTMLQSVAYDSIIFPGNYGIYTGSTIYNCLVVGGDYGCNTSTSHAHNSWFLGIARPAHNASSTLTNCLMSWTRYDASNSAINCSSCRYNSTYYQTSSNPGTITKRFNFQPANEIIRHMSQAFKPYGWQDWAMGDSGSASSESIDIEGASRTARGVKHLGPWAFTEMDVETDATNGTEVTLNREGEVVLYMPVKANTQLTVRVYAETALDGGSLYPRLSIEGDGITTQTDTATTTAETLSVTITGSEPDYDTTAKVRLIAREDNTSATAKFYNLEIEES